MDPLPTSGGVTRRSDLVNHQLQIVRRAGTGGSNKLHQPGAYEAVVDARSAISAAAYGGSDSDEPDVTTTAATWLDTAHSGVSLPWF